MQRRHTRIHLLVGVDSVVDPVGNAVWQLAQGSWGLGLLGALCGMMGSLQTTEVLKEIMGIGDSLSGALLVVDGLGTEFRKIRVKADPGCPVCGDNPTITDLSVHEGAETPGCAVNG